MKTQYHQVHKKVQSLFISSQ